MEHMRNYNELCRSISVDEPLKTLFRVTGKTKCQTLFFYVILSAVGGGVACPITGTYSFTYSRGHGLCSYPLSSLHQCAGLWEQESRRLTANIILRVKLNPPEIPPSSRNCLFLFDVCPLYEMSVSPPQSLLVMGIEIKIYLFHAGATELSCEPTFMIDQH